MAFTSIRFTPRILTLFLSVLCFPVSTLCARPGDAEKHRVNLGELASTLDTGMRTAGVKSVAVADFLGADGSSSDLTWYISGKLSDAVRKDIADSNGPRFVSRGALADSKLTIEEMNSLEALARTAAIWGVAAIVTGTVEISADKYVVKATVRNVSDGSVVVTAGQDLPHLRILDLLLPGGIDQEGVHAKTVGADGVVAPACQYCPIPSYSEDARAAKIQTAKVTLMVTVSTKGEAIKVALTKNPGFGLGEKAIEDVSEWKFSPAMQNGKPVTVAVPVEVEFKLSRT
jgi:TonB family protein